MSDIQGTLDEQLDAIYAEREWLSKELGCCDAESIVEMVRSLENQLNDLYQSYGSAAPVGSNATLQLLNYVQELSQHLDGMYSEKSVSFQIENDQPVVKATWREVNNHEGAQS